MSQRADRLATPPAALASAASESELAALGCPGSIHNGRNPRYSHVSGSKLNANFSLAEVAKM